MSADQQDSFDFQMDPADVDEFEARCRDEGVECEVVRGVAEDVITVLGVAPLVYEAVKFTALRVQGSPTKIAALDRFVDRKKGAHVIYTGGEGALVDGRCKTLPYGMVYVHETRAQLDIDATPRIVDTRSREELAGQIKEEVGKTEMTMTELCELVRSWPGIRRAELFARQVKRRIAGGESLA
ncbi:hypothetical protein L2K20_05435 [Mycobacterium sp. MBM]|nr:hypothetical protein [Mycobacterium sp. MBM]